MKKCNFVIATIVLGCAFTAAAQENKNLIFTNVEHEASLKALCFDGDEFGVAVSYRHQSHVFGWEVEAGSTVKNQQASSFADVMAGVRTNTASVRFGVDAGIGVGQIWEDLYYEKTDWDHSYRSNTLRPYAVGRLSVVFRCSENVSLSIFGGGRYFFYTPSTNESLDGYELVDKKSHKAQWFAGASLSFVMNSQRISGDNCWLLEGLGGWSNQGGAFAGAKAVQFKRTGAKIGRTLGFGSTYAKNSNEVFAQAGLRFLPSGANSPVVYDLFVTAGMSQYEKDVNGASEDKDHLVFAAKSAPVGFNGKLNAEISYHVGEFSIGAGGFAGGYATCKTDFDGDDNYSGNTSKTNGVLYGAYAKFGLRF